jgi:hypothetical protein
MNSSPSSKELLAEALPMLVKQGIDFASFVPQDVANKYKRSGYSVSIQGFDYNFKGENMVKYLAVSNPNVSLKVFGKNLNEISTKEIKDYDKSINLKYEPVEIKGDLIEKAGRDAAKIFETYLNQFGIQVKDINEIKDKLGIDELGFADILSKIAYVKDKKDLPPVAGEFIAYMMQYNPLVSDIIKELSQTTSYKNLNKEQYFKIIGGLIADDLQNKLEGNYSKSLLDKLKQLIKKFFSLLRDTPIDLINKNIGIISDNILQQNKKLITSSLYKPGAFGKPTKQVSLQEAMESDKFGASIIKNLSKKGFILTGSTSLGEQGTIQRPDENLLHDIDWVSPFNRKQTEDLFKEVYPEAIKIRDIYGDGYITDTWIIAPKGYKIINLNKESDYNIITSYDIVNTDTNEVVGTYRLQEQTDSNQKEEVVTGIEAKVIDFFTYDNYNERPPFEKDGIKLSNWKDIFKAKLQFARYKDIWDYNRFIPNDNVSQITQQQGSVERFKDWINNRQKNEEELVEYLKQKYPEIKLTITNNPIWEQGDNVFNQEEYNNQVRYRLKAIDILSSDKAKQIFEKGKKANWDLNKILTELQVPKEQKQLILDLGKTNREEIITDLLANYSYTVEINTAKNIISSNPILGNSQLPEGYVFYTDEGLKVTWQNNILDLGSVGIELYQLTDRPDISKAYYKELEKFKPVEKPTQHYSNLTVPGGTNYTENEIATPAITPSIEGHAQFSTPNGLMWSRTDERVQYEEQDIDNLLKIMENSKILQIKCS